MRDLDWYVFWYEAIKISYISLIEGEKVKRFDGNVTANRLNDLQEKYGRDDLNDRSKLRDALVILFATCSIDEIGPKDFEQITEVLNQQETALMMLYLNAMISVNISRETSESARARVETLDQVKMSNEKQLKALRRIGVDDEIEKFAKFILDDLDFAFEREERWVFAE